MAKLLKRALSRIVGFDTPIGGLSWTAPPLESKVAADIVAELADRRVLYNPSEAESPHHCLLSVIDIRRMLTAALKNVETGSALSAHVNAMLAAARKFMDRVQALASSDGSDFGSFGHWKSWEFQDALGQMRGVFGVHLALMEVRYALIISADLARIMPDAVGNRNAF